MGDDKLINKEALDEKELNKTSGGSTSCTKRNYPGNLNQYVGVSTDDRPERNLCSN